MTLTVLSLFDGMSCGQIALGRVGISCNYYASEIDKYAIKVTQSNYPNTHQLGDATGIKGSDLPKIDLLIGGSPCQGFSYAGKRLKFNDPRSKLFFHYLRMIEECRPKYYLLENVPMGKYCESIISQCLGASPVMINSSLLSAQNRRRLYWTNIPRLTQPKDKGITWQDVKELNNGYNYYYCTDKPMQNSKSNVIKLPCDKESAAAIRGRYVEESLTVSRVEYIEFRYDGKANALTTSRKNNIVVPFTLPHKIPSKEFFFRYMTPIECERLQTIPDNYTSLVSKSQRYKMLGNGWTVDVIAHIFKGLL